MPITSSHLSTRFAEPLFRRLAELAACLAFLALAGCASISGLDSGANPAAAPGLHPVRAVTADGPLLGAAGEHGAFFLGIPYAAPPVGPLRWRAPQRPRPWRAARPGMKLGPPCLQAIGLGAFTGSPGSGVPRGAEDCLTLNVYAPPGVSFASGRGAKNLPVMVWFFGGAFLIGAGGDYDPSLLAEREHVVVVTFNYRLGAFGFLAHPGLTAEAMQNGSGNYALLDQQAVLRWVRANIARFGGNPGNVTLFGESAGGFSICDQMISPGAAGLFHRAIIESGACTMRQAATFQKVAEAGGLAFAASLGCSDPAQALACLRGMPASKILAAHPARPGVMGEQSWAPSFGNAVLPLAPPDAFRRGRFHHVAVMVGTNHKEGRLFSYLLRLAGELWSEESYRRTVASIYGADAPAILAAYPANANGSPAPAFADAVTDGSFACPALRLDRTLTRFATVHAYEFDDADAITKLPALPGLPRLEAYHSSEIAYIFQTPWVLQDPAAFTPAQRAFSDSIQDRWGAFARSGTPSLPGTRDWQPFRHGEAIERLAPDTLAPPSAVPPAFAEAHRCAFWDGLEP